MRAVRHLFSGLPKLRRKERSKNLAMLAVEVLLDRGRVGVSPIRWFVALQVWCGLVLDDKTLQGCHRLFG